MAKFRIETETDPKTIKVYAEFYNPDDAEQPLALMSASAGKQTFRIFNSNVRLILKADVQNNQFECLLHTESGRSGESDGRKLTA